MRNPNITILLVEDNRVDALFMEKMLNAVYEHAAFNHVTTLAEALSLVKQQTYDVILLDLFLPDSEGVDTVRALHDAASDVPIVVLTSQDSASTAASTLREGARGYLVKHQLTKEIFVRAVGSAVAQHKRARAASRPAPDRTFPLHAVLEHLSDAILVLDQHRVIQYANRRAEYFFGCRAKRLIGTHFSRPEQPEAWTPPNVALRAMRLQVREAEAHWQQHAGVLVTLAEADTEALHADPISETICLFNDRSVCLDVIPGASSPGFLSTCFQPGAPFDAHVPAASSATLAEAFAHVWAERASHRFTFGVPDQDGQWFQVEGVLRLGGNASLMMTLRTQLVPMMGPAGGPLPAGNPAAPSERVKDRPSRLPGLSLIRSLPTARPDSDSS